MIIINVLLPLMRYFYFCSTAAKFDSCRPFCRLVKSWDFRNAGIFCKKSPWRNFVFRGVPPEPRHHYLREPLGKLGLDGGVVTITGPVVMIVMSFMFFSLIYMIFYLFQQIDS